MVAAIWVTTGWLLATTRGVLAHDKTANGADRAQVRVEVVRTGLAAGAGVGAAVGLMLAFRRQRHQEVATALSDHDAAERRITALYTAAADQLGSDKAPVRLTALYTLERLAGDNPGHRQTIVNIICAYLRMPYTPPDQADRPRAWAIRDHHRVYKATKAHGTAAPPTAVADVREERQVRLTAQRILTDHLREPAGRRFWNSTDLDLTGATLADLDLSNCTINTARFDGATFNGNAGFEGTTFTESAEFGGATFNGDAGFDNVTFTGRAWFAGATFIGDAMFDNATFTKGAWFDNATFIEGAGFANATFNGDAWFGNTIFVGEAWFKDATFASGAAFEGATFTEGAAFGSVTFTESAEFDDATFTKDAVFEGAAFTGDAGFGGATFTRIASFNGATFDKKVAWPDGWILGLEGLLQEKGSIASATE